MSLWHRVAPVTGWPVFALVKGHDRVSGTHSQLERLAVDYIGHYNQHRPHRSLNQRPPQPTEEATAITSPLSHVVRSTRCAGLINEYQNAA